MQQSVQLFWQREISIRQSPGGLVKTSIIFVTSQICSAFYHRSTMDKSLHLPVLQLWKASLCCYIWIWMRFWGNYSMSCSRLPLRVQWQLPSFRKTCRYWIAFTQCIEWMLSNLCMVLLKLSISQFELFKAIHYYWATLILYIQK